MTIAQLDRASRLHSPEGPWFDAMWSQDQDPLPFNKEPDSLYCLTALRYLITVDGLGTGQLFRKWLRVAITRGTAGPGAFRNVVAAG